MCNEAVLPFFHVIFQNLPGRTMESPKDHHSWIRGRSKEKTGIPKVSILI